MYKEIENSLLSNRYGKVMSLEIALTQECNYQCPYCGAYKTEDKYLLSLTDIKELIDSCQSLKSISFSGGEVLLKYEECKELCKYCKSKEISTQINTNASLLTEKRILELKEAGLNVLHISLNFGNARDYMKYYGKSDLVYNNIVKMIKFGGKVFKENLIVEAILCNDFEEQIIPVSSLLNSLEIQSFQIQFGVTQEIWKNKQNKENTIRLLLELFHKKSKNMQIYVSCIQLSEYGQKLFEKFLSSESGVQFVPCIEGKWRFHLNRNGDLVVCDLGFPYLLGNVREGLDMNNLDISNPEMVAFLKNHTCKKCCII